MSKTVSKAFRRTLGGISAVLCSAAVALTVGAETSGKISFDISTDKASYSVGEQVNVSMNVSNDGYYAITDVNMNASIPSGFVLTPESSSSAYSEVVAAGGTMQGDFSMTFSGGNNIPSPVIPSVVPSRPSNNSVNNEVVPASKDETADKNDEDVSSASGTYENGELITIGGTSFHAGRTIAAFLICLAVFAGIFLVRKKKNAKKLLSIFIALCAVLPMIGNEKAIEVFADTSKNETFNDSVKFTYGSNTYTINAVLTFMKEQGSDSSAQAYYEENSEEIISIESVSEDNTLTEKEAAKMLAERGLAQITAIYEYDNDGKYVGECEIDANSDVKHPMYQTMYITEAGEVWNVFIVRKEIFACPLTYNFGSDTLVEYIFGETDALSCYADSDNKYYMTIPKKSSVAFHIIDRVNAEELEKLTFEEIDKL